MRFISQLNHTKFGIKNIINKATWFNTSIATKFNVPIAGTYIKSNEKLNFGNEKYTSTFVYTNEFSPLKQQKFIANIKPSDQKNLTKITNKLKEINPNSKNKKEQIKIKSLNTKKTNLDYISKNITKTEKIQIFPTEKQHTLLQKWIEESIKCYNKCVDLYTKNNKFFVKGHKMAKIEVFKELYDGDKSAPYDTLTDEVRKFCSNLKSCLTNLKNGHIKKFEMKHINKYKSTFTIFIPKTAVKSSSIYSTHLGKMKGLENVQAVARDCTLSYDKSKDKYFLNTPKVSKRTTVKNRESVCAVDEGEVSIVTYHSENSFGHLGLNTRPTYLKKLGEISRLQKILKKGKNKKGNKLKNKSKLKRTIQKKYEKLQNVSKELRNKISLFLVRKFDKIILTKFEKKKMIRNKKYTKDYFNKLEEEKGKEEMRKELRQVTKKRRMNGKIKFSLNMQSHYKLKQHLINKANEYGCILVTDADENETTKTCTICGSTENLKYKRTRECLCCGTKMDRDISAARNTLLKNISKGEMKY